MKQFMMAARPQLYHVVCGLWYVSVFSCSIQCEWCLKAKSKTQVVMGAAKRHKSKFE